MKSSYLVLGSILLGSVASASTIDPLSSWDGDGFLWYWVPPTGSNHYMETFSIPNEADTMLTSVDARIAVLSTVPWSNDYKPEPILGEVRVYEWLSGDNLGSLVYTSSPFTVAVNNGNWNDIHVDTDAVLNPGTQYALDFVNLSGGVAKFGACWNNPYNAGGAFFSWAENMPNCKVLGSENTDLAIRASFAPAPVPEPVSIIGLGVGALAVAVKRRRK